jgi:NTP pyrophosphatase (non-canonical NTP hydrolase)
LGIFPIISGNDSMGGTFQCLLRKSSAPSWRSRWLISTKYDIIFVRDNEVILMKELEEKIVKFAEDRDWLQFNTPENLAKSISIEAGELLECFQWNNNYDKDELKYEIADVMNYCILLCHQIGVDPKQIVLDKMEISAKKYPIDKAKGVSTKYDKL